LETKYQTQAHALSVRGFYNAWNILGIGSIKMMMIKITPTNGEDRLFENYHQVCSYINSIERRKTSESGEKIWSFIRHRYETLCSLYYRTPSLKNILTTKEKEAVEKEMGLVEIIKGNREHITQLLVTNRVDVEPLKRDWCKEYCIDRGFRLSELVTKET
jgi:hypothetical protein